MACCDEKTTPEMMPAMKDLPDSTFCCMGRMAYAVASTAALVLVGDEHPTWASLSEEDKLKLGGMAKKVLLGEPLGPSKFEFLFERIVKTMATAA